MSQRDRDRGGRVPWGLLALAWIAPLALASTALALRARGVAAEVAASTRRELVDAAARALSSWQSALDAPELAEAMRLERDLESGTWRPFAAWRAPAPRGAAPSLALELALDAERRGAAEEALRFFELAHAESPTAWSAEARLAEARALHAAGRSAEARAILTTLGTSALESEGPLSTALLAALTEARFAAETGDLAPAQITRARLLRGELALPAAAASAVLQFLRELGLAPTPEESLFAAAARIVQRFEEGETWERVSAPFEELAWFHPLDDGSARVLSISRAQELLRATLVEAERLAPHLRLELVDGRVKADLRGTAPAIWIERLELALFALALLAFLLGHALALRVALREARLARLKSEFVDRVSHELRTPLTAAALQAEMLASGKVPPEKLARYHRGLRAEIERLSQLVQRVLDFARLSRGRLPFEPREVSLRAVLARGLRAGRGALRLAGQKVEVRAPRDMPSLQLDPALLETALANLLENCARHAPRASAIELEVACERDACVLAVLDRGPGVPPEERARIFEPFQRGAASATKPGSGLGLALVREAARLHGGTAEFAPREGGGSIFRLRLPLRKVESR
ncbi:MAG: hypothetical protein JNM84_04655 [Planctomycetes bacterium]|nr:hypothetical protein [Planctomycetota bacterium]